MTRKYFFVLPLLSGVFILGGTQSGFADLQINLHPKAQPAADVAQGEELEAFTFTFADDRGEAESAVSAPPMEELAPVSVPASASMP